MKTKYILINEEERREEYKELTKEQLIVKLLDLEEKYEDKCLEYLEQMELYEN